MPPHFKDTFLKLVYLIVKKAIQEIKKLKNPFTENLHFYSIILTNIFLWVRCDFMIVNKLLLPVMMLLITSLLVSCHSTKETLTIGMIPLREEAVMKEEYEPFRRYLEQQLNMPIKYKVTDSYVSLIEEMENGTIDIGYYGAFSFVVGESNLDLIPLVTPQRERTGPYYQSIIISKKDSTIHSINDLKDKSFAFVEEGSTSGFVLPYALFKSRNIHYETYFKEYTYSGTHEKVVMDIVNGKIDAGAISSAQFDYLVGEGKINVEDFNILWKSEDIPSSLFVARNDLNDEIVQKFIEATLKMHEESPEAIHAINEKIEKYIIANDSYYNSIRNISTLLGKDFMHNQFLKADH